MMQEQHTIAATWQQTVLEQRELTRCAAIEATDSYERWIDRVPAYLRSSGPFAVRTKRLLAAQEAAQREAQWWAHHHWLWTASVPIELPGLGRRGSGLDVGEA